MHPDFTEIELENIPKMVGTLKEPQGIKGFHVAEVGHPVFELKDRYIIYLQSKVELKERVYNPELKGHETKVGYFMVAIPYYKDSLAKIIDFAI